MFQLKILLWSRKFYIGVGIKLLKALEFRVRVGIEVEVGVKIGVGVGIDNGIGGGVRVGEVRTGLEFQLWWKLELH